MVAGLVGTPQAVRLRPAPDASTASLWSTEWSGLPARTASRLGCAAALALLDRSDGDGPCGRQLHEEYVEWRAVRDSGGRLQRVELTTELPEYWTVLAAHEPARLLALVAAFAGEDHVRSRRSSATATRSRTGRRLKNARRASVRRCCSKTAVQQRHVRDQLHDPGPNSRRCGWRMTADTDVEDVMG